MAEGIVKYKASDGSDVKLSPSIVARYIIAGNQPASDKDIFAFMAKCQARHLNPLAGDAYMTTYKNKDGSVTSNVIVSKDYFVRTAAQQEGFDGIRAGVVVVDRSGQMVYREGSIVGRQTEKLVGGWAEVYDKRRAHPSRAEVSLDEYDTGRSLWKTKPATMIRKVALVQALREAYEGRIAAADARGGRDLYDESAFGFSEPVCWIFGAEGPGVSERALAVSDVRLYIPIDGRVESLNVSAAAAVCLFEMRRRRRIAVSDASSSIPLS